MIFSRAPIWFFAVAIWFAALFLLSSQSDLAPPGPQFENRDKVLHATYFAMGATCLFVALRLSNPTRSVWKTSLIVFLCCAAIGVTDEFHQSFVPHRSGNDLGDLMADAFGGILGCGFGTFFYRIFRPKTSASEHV